MQKPALCKHAIQKEMEMPWQEVDEGDRVKMKLILENWKKYLKEEKDLPLGKYVWPKDSLLVDPEKEKEINTALEDKLKDSIGIIFKVLTLIGIQLLT